MFRDWLDYCLICKKLLWRESVFCAACASGIKKSSMIFRELESLPVFSLFHYGDSTDTLVKVWKDRKKVSVVCEKLGQELAQKFALEFYEIPRLVVPMPPKEPEYRDHAYILAEQIAHYFNVPLATQFLERGSDTFPQKVKTAIRRKEVYLKLKEDFKIDDQSHEAVLFVDDVVTTGSTLLAAWKLLGRPRSVGLTVASTPKFLI